MEKEIVEGKTIQINTIRDDWALALMSQGVIVKLSVGRWRGFSKITPELLGLKFCNEEGFAFSKKYLDLGRQRLLPIEVAQEIDVVEIRARSNLEIYSFDTVWGRFVPFTAFNEWESSNNIIRNDFLKQGKVLGERYDSIVSAVKDEYRKMAKDVWLRMYPDDKGGATEAFIENFVLNIAEKIPSKEKIVESFKYSSTFFIIPMPSFVADNIAQAEKIRRDDEVAAFESELEKQTKTRIKEEYVKRKKELIDGFLESTVVSMRKYVSELCSSVLMSIGRNGRSKITVSHVSRLKDMIKKIKFLNFYNDKEISDLIKDLGIEVDKIKGEIDEPKVVDKLKEIVEIGEKEYCPSNFNPSISALEL